MPAIKELKEQRAQLLEELASLSQLLHGSWVERYSVCSRRDCKCRKGERHGPRYYLVINEGGRQLQKYIPQSQLEAAQTGLKQYHRLLEILDQITHINLQLIKERKYADQ